MRIYLNTIKDKENYILEDVGRLDELNSYFQIKKFNSINCNLEISKLDNIYELKVELDSEISAISSYSLKVFPYKLSLNDKLYFTLNELYENDDVILLENDFIDIDEIIYSLIITEIPVNIHEKDESLKNYGDIGVLKEEEVVHQSKFDVLDDIDL